MKALIIFIYVAVALITLISFPDNCSALSYNALETQAIGKTVSLSNTKLLFDISPVFIPWHNTHSLGKGITTLNRMYNSLSDNDPLKTFLSNHCSHLLKPLKGHTNIPTNYTDPTILMSLPNTVKLEPKYTPSQFIDLTKKVGIYAFFIEGKLSVHQCGSSIRFLNRMMNHYKQAIKGGFIFTDYKIQDYHWTPLGFSPNYVDLFSQGNNMTKEQESILNAFMEQEIRSLEQAYSTYAKPTNYKGYAISTSHNNWQVGDIYGKTDGKRIKWITSDGKVFTRSSITAGADELGYSLTYLKKVAASNNPVLVTEQYGSVNISIENINALDYDVRYGTPLNTSVDTTQLLENHYYIYNTSMEQLSFGPFRTVAELNKFMGLDLNYSGTYLWCNYMHTIKSKTLNADVYVVKGLSSTKVPIIVENLATGEVNEYPSINSALKVIYPNNRGGYNVLKTMVKGTPLLTPDGTKYKLTFKDSGHLALSTKKYNSHKLTKHQDKII